MRNLIASLASLLVVAVTFTGTAFANGVPNVVGLPPPPAPAPAPAVAPAAQASVDPSTEQCICTTDGDCKNPLMRCIGGHCVPKSKPKPRKTKPSKDNICEADCVKSIDARLTAWQVALLSGCPVVGAVVPEPGKPVSEEVRKNPVCHLIYQVTLRLQPQLDDIVKRMKEEEGKIVDLRERVEKALAELEALKTGLQGLPNRVENLETKIEIIIRAQNDLTDELRNVKRRLDVLEPEVKRIADHVAGEFYGGPGLTYFGETNFLAVVGARLLVGAARVKGFVGMQIGVSADGRSFLHLAPEAGLSIRLDKGADIDRTGKVDLRFGLTYHMLVNAGYHSDSAADSTLQRWDVSAVVGAQVGVGKGAFIGLDTTYGYGEGLLANPLRLHRGFVFSGLLVAGYRF